jgi:hypothetical protein
MPRLKISDLSFCEVLAEKEIEVKGGLTFAELGINFGVESLLKRLIADLSELPDLYYIPLEVTPLPCEDGNTVEMLENTSAGISGYQVTSQDGTTKFGMLTGTDFVFASTSSIKSS